MSEIRLVVFDATQSIHGQAPASITDAVLGSLAAEPETLAEWRLALSRFLGCKTEGVLARLSTSDPSKPWEPEPWDAGLLVVDLAARLIVGKSTFSEIAKEGSAAAPGCRRPVPYRLSDDWLVLRDVESWRAVAEERRAVRSQAPPLDVREVLYGRELLEFIADSSDASAEELTEAHAEELVRLSHAAWLMQPRDSLRGQSPREVLLAKREFLTWDLQYREYQWSDCGAPPVGLAEESHAFRFGGIGPHERIVYYHLLRFLWWEQAEQRQQNGPLERAEVIDRLERLRDAWLNTPDPEFSGSIPGDMINNERRRMPEGSTGAKAAVDPDNCPCCQMMAEDLGPFFWHLDGAEMDDDFEFSDHATREEWEEEQRRTEEFNREFNERWAQREAAGDVPAIWTSCYVEEQPTSVAVALFGFAAMIGELGEDLRTEGDASQADLLMRLFGNLRDALSEAEALIDPCLDRVVAELKETSRRRPDLAAKCDDLERRLVDLPRVLEHCGEAPDDDIPF